MYAHGTYSAEHHRNSPKAYLCKKMTTVPIARGKRHSSRRRQDRRLRLRCCRQTMPSKQQSRQALCTFVAISFLLPFPPFQSLRILYTFLRRHAVKIENGEYQNRTHRSASYCHTRKIMIFYATMRTATAPRRILVIIPTATLTQRQLLEGLLGYTHESATIPWQLHLDLHDLNRQHLKDCKSWNCSGIIAYTTMQ